MSTKKQPQTFSVAFIDTIMSEEYISCDEALIRRRAVSLKQ